MKILTVDDDEIASDILKAALINANYTDVTTFSSAQEALDFLDTSQVVYDCFMLDIMMPGIDGVALCKMLRETEHYASVPIIMISALADQGHIDRSFSAGATDYVTKPFNGLELGARVRAASALSKVVKAEEAARMRAISLTFKVNTLEVIELAKRFDLEDVPEACDLFELENSLLKLPDGSHAIRVLAFKILQVEDAHSQLKSSAFREMVNKVAGCISSGIDSTKLQIAYAGNGTYICTDFGPGKHSSSDIEKTVKEAVKQLQIVDHDGDEIEIGIIMGRPAATNFWSSLEAAAGIKKALERMQLIETEEQVTSALEIMRPTPEQEDSLIKDLNAAMTLETNPYVPIIPGRRFFEKIRPRS